MIFNRDKQRLLQHKRQTNMKEVCSLGGNSPNFLRTSYDHSLIYHVGNRGFLIKHFVVKTLLVLEQR